MIDAVLPTGFEIAHFPDAPAPAAWRQPVVAIGNFDGLHRGHMKIIDRVCRQAVERHATPLVLTFEPHPPRVVRPDKAPPLLMTPGQKLAALARTGIQGAAIVRFTPELSLWPPERFVQSVLVDWLRVSEVWVGGNFLFGHERSGNFSLLRSLGGQLGFRAEKIDPVRYKEFVVSSTRIRRLVGEGRVDEAGALLGHLYTLEGTIVAGDGRGRTLGFPTANLDTPNELVPPHGVYATVVNLEGELQAAVTNIGVRPTVASGSGRTVETHLIGLDRDLYGAAASVAFVQRLRDERAFDAVGALQAQIAQDIDRTVALFDRISL